MFSLHDRVRVDDPNAGRHLRRVGAGNRRRRRRRVKVEPQPASDWRGWSRTFRAIYALERA